MKKPIFSEELFMIIIQNVYSYFMAVTGFSEAAFMEWKLMVAMATIQASMPERKKINQVWFT